MRAKVASALRSSQPPKSNLNKEERQAAKRLKKEDSIIILPADKGTATVGAKVASALRLSQPPKSNLNKEERQAAKKLKKEDSIIILPADKRRATVVLDKNDYNEKVNSMLADSKTYYCRSYSDL